MPIKRDLPVDVEVVGGGTVFMFMLLSSAARRWVDEFVSPHRQMWGDGLVVEWRYAAALDEAMRRAGLVVVEEGAVMKAATYLRVSTSEQTVENQRLELRRFCEARGWDATEYADTGVSGAKESRPALDRMLKDARRRRFDTLVVWKLDRLGRNLRHLILLLDELSALGVAFVSLNEGIDTTTPAGRLQLHLLGAVAEYERGVIAERVKLGMARAKAQGKPVGRPRRAVTDIDLAAVTHLPVRQAAAALGVSKSFVANWRVSTRVVETAPAGVQSSSDIPTSA